MDIYITITVLLSLSATFAYVNHRFIKMPFVIGLFFQSTIVSLLILMSRFWYRQPFNDFKLIIAQTDISKFILEIMLGFLLFAGSLHTDWPNVKKQLKPIVVLAVGGVIISTLIIAGLFYGLCSAFNLQIDFIYCLLFGCLISPTDPIAVLGILTKAGVPKKIESIIVGESLFNDGVGVVLFITLLETLNSGTGAINYSNFGLLFLQESVGGIIFGLGIGFILHKLLATIDHYETELLLTIAFVMAGYSLCLYLHLSGPLAMVVMGLLIGNYKTSLAMSDTTKEYVHKFWELVDVILNAILFILIALVLVVISFKSQYFLIGVIAIPIILLTRIIVVYIPRFFLPRTFNINHKDARLIIWGGLRGGLSIALVLSLPESEQKNLLVVATYVAVLFSILVQGLTIGKLSKSVS